MSQSRSRKAKNFGGENGCKPRSSVVKDGDVALSVHHENPPKTKQNSRTNTKIPKSLRYDLDSALVSLCDVWFDDIKPHLVRDKIKLHVENSGATTTASGDVRWKRSGAPSCSHDDPASVPQHCQRTPANSAACCQTPQPASKVRFVRQPMCRPQSPVHCRLSTITQNKNIKKRSPKGSHKEVPPQSSIPSAAGRPRLSYQPSVLSSGTKIRRVNTAPSSIVHHPCKVLKKHKKSQTNITWVNYKSTYDATVNTASYTVFPTNTNISASKNRKPRVQQRRMKTKSLYSEITNPDKNATSESSHKHKLSSTTISPTRLRPTLPEVLNKLTEEVPVHTTRIHRSQNKKPNINSVKCKKQTGERKVDPSIAPQSNDTEDKSNSQFFRCYATTNLNQAKSKECVNGKISDTEFNVIYEQDLIDIIGTKNDKRLRILYKSPVREESDSSFNLFPSPHQRILEKRSRRKTVPWR